ncbi:MAG: MBOAT family protein [Polyangiaceae bacterium]
MAPLDLRALLLGSNHGPLLFHSAGFVVLFIGFILVHALLAGKDRARLVWILAFSLFYYWRSNGLYTVVLLGLATLDWSLAHAVHRTQRPRSRTLFLALSLGANLAALGFFKYTNFLLSTIASLRGAPSHPLDIFLPLGISFHVFQSMSYLIDVYRRRYTPTKSLLEYVAFLCFFPQIVAGPIVRAPEFFGGIHPIRDPEEGDVSRALGRILVGVVKKAILADYLARYVDWIFAAPSTYSGPEVLLGVYAYCLQIYFDFSGYSDMALGMAKLLGVTIPENFRSPYKAVTITEFWRRWHISLSTWLREYLYISLGGNRHGRARQLAALALTMLLGGLWHGASWTFVVWGGLHGLALAFDKLTPSLLSTRARPLAWLATFHFVALAWVFFRAPTFGLAFDVLKAIAAGWSDTPLLALASERRGVVAALVVGALFCALPEKLVESLHARALRVPALAKGLAFGVLAVVVAEMSDVDVRPFVYFQF